MSEEDTAVASEAPAESPATSSESGVSAPTVEAPAAASPPPSPVSPALEPTPTSSPTPPTPEISPSETPVPEVIQPPPSPQPSSAPAQSTSQSGAVSIKDRLYVALEKIQFRKRAKLDKILVLAAKKHSIKNDDVEKLLKVSDATASRYLAQLVKEGKLQRSGSTASIIYEPI